MHIEAVDVGLAFGEDAVAVLVNPADAIEVRRPGAVAAARRHDLALRATIPRHVDEVVQPADLVITVCDAAHEELASPDAAHWSVPDPARSGDTAAFDTAVTDLAGRISRLAPTVTRERSA